MDDVLALQDLSPIHRPDGVQVVRQHSLPAPFQDGEVLLLFGCSQFLVRAPVNPLEVSIDVFKSQVEMPSSPYICAFSTDADADAAMSLQDKFRAMMADQDLCELFLRVGLKEYGRNPRKKISVRWNNPASGRLCVFCIGRDVVDLIKKVKDKIDNLGLMDSWPQVLVTADPFDYRLDDGRAFALSGLDVDDFWDDLPDEAQYMWHQAEAAAAGMEVDVPADSYALPLPAPPVAAPVVHEAVATRPRRSSRRGGVSTYLQERVRKTFDGVDYEGTVVSMSDGLWHIVYDDSDSEDMDESEVMQFMQQYRNHHQTN